MPLVAEVAKYNNLKTISSTKNNNSNEGDLFVFSRWKSVFGFYHRFRCYIYRSLFYSKKQYQFVCQFACDECAIGDVRKTIYFQ